LPLSALRETSLATEQKNPQSHDVKAIREVASDHAPSYTSRTDGRYSEKLLHRLGACEESRVDGNYLTVERTLPHQEVTVNSKFDHNINEDLDYSLLGAMQGISLKSDPIGAIKQDVFLVVLKFEFDCVCPAQAEPVRKSEQRPEGGPVENIFL
jgi:hypothetical protein